MLGETLTCFLFGDNLVNGNNIVEKNSLIGWWHKREWSPLSQTQAKKTICIEFPTPPMQRNATKNGLRKALFGL
jgi:hypothetical protein